VPNIGDAFLGGFFAGYISHTANGVATHALIVAPRATGASGTGYTLTTNYQYKTTRTTTAGSASTFDGRANTDAAIAAGISVHPAAQFCVNLTIGGYTDWYVPSRFELDIAYFHLKPTTDANNTSTGANNYSVPIRAANYTAGVPPMSLISAFNSTGAERFSTSTFLWSSTEASATGNNAMNVTSGAFQSLVKDSGATVRAFRRVPV
jgi:hypothetical protein